MSHQSNYLRIKKPVDSNLAKLLNGVITSMLEAIQQAGNNRDISVSGKSAKILNGVNKFS